MRRLFLLLLCACFFGFCCQCRPAAATPSTKLTLALGAAQKAPLFRSSTSAGFMGEMKLRVTGRDMGAFAEVRHCFESDPYLERKSKVKAGLDFYATPTTAVFCEFERSYHTGDEWGFAGLRFDLGRWFNR